MKKIIIITCLLTSLVLILCIVMGIRTNDDGIGREKTRYEDTSNVKISHTKKEGLAKVTVKDSYRKNGEEYYEITTSVSGINVYTFSEKEYEAAFGIGNTAVDCEIYSLTMTVNIVDYEPSILGSQVKRISLDELQSYENNPLGLQMNFTIIEPNTLTYQKENKDGSVSKYIVERHLTNKGDTLTVKLKETRFSFLGESDFTEDEIKEREESLDQLCKHLLEAFLDTYQ